MSIGSNVPMKSPMKIEHVGKSHIQSRRTIYQYYMITSMKHKMLPSESLVLQTKVEKKFLHRNAIGEGERTALDELIK
jgi:hypothetical protein